MSIRQSNSEPGPDEGSREERAAEWFVLVTSGSAAASDVADCEAWQAADPRNRAAYEKLSAFYRSNLLGTAVRNTQEGVASPSRRPARSRSALSPLSWAAAGLAACLCIAFATNEWSRWTSDFSSRIGEIKQIALDEGSAMILDSDSAADRQFTADLRRIDLRKGRVHLDVVSDPSRPFIVEAGGLQVTVTGTAFDIQLLDDGLRVAVEHGAVTVGQTDAEAQPVVLNAGQTAVFGGDGTILFRNDTARFDWRHGRFKFRRETVAAVMKRLERYIPGRIVVMDAEIAGQRINGSYPLDDPAETARRIADIVSADLTGHERLLLILH
ncbi:FecR family protein [Algihabitans sp.]|uniref:FecR family protein n=1 Tax=Algihabitans sp. TaxID=2821514 RepID=UPI003BAC6E70